jgi:hypothetical protein
MTECRTARPGEPAGRDRGSRSRLRRHAAPVGRIVAGGLSITATGVLMTGMALGRADQAASTVELAAGPSAQEGASPSPDLPAAPPVTIVRRHLLVSEGGRGSASSGRRSASGATPGPASRSVSGGTTVQQGGSQPSASVPPVASSAPTPAPKPVTKSHAS